MKCSSNRLKVRPPAFMLLFTALLLPPTPAAAVEEAEHQVLTATEDQSKTQGRILQRLKQGHYRVLSYNDELSSDLYDRYLAYLDPARSLFLAEDILELEAYRFTLDDGLRRGNLDGAFKIFNRFAERLVGRYEFLIRALKEDFHSLRFDGDDTLELDREAAPWLASEEAADALWSKLFKNDVLNLRLAGRSMEEIEEILERRYQDRLHRAKQTNSDDVFQVYMNVFTHSYDPHTDYFAPRRAENFDIQMKLSYEGIGALLTTDGEYIKVSRIIPAGPAEKSNRLHAGDRIVGVAQGPEGEMTDTIGWRLDEVVDLIRGPKGTVVRLNVLPVNQPDTGSTRIVDLTRDQVKLEEQAAKRKIVELEKGGRTFKVGIIELPTFYVDFKAMDLGDPEYKSSTRDVARLVDELKREGVDGILVDLRDNGGGSLMEARDLTALFAGPGAIVQIRDPEGRVQVLGSKETPAYDGPLAVMVNRLSASASEIFAAAVQDYGRGIVIGSRSFGKGTVQTLLPLRDGGQLKLTQAKFYRISGGSTQHRGVIPDVLFPPVYDPEEIGESAMEGAMLWDKIDPVDHETSDLVEKNLPALLKLHKKRASAEPEFVYIADRLAYLEEMKKKTTVSLNEEVRKAERQENEARRLAMENKRRMALGQDPVESFDDLEGPGAEGEGSGDDGAEDPGAEDADTAGGNGDQEVDAMAREAANILVDLVERS